MWANAKGKKKADTRFCYNTCVSSNHSEFFVLINVPCIPDERYASVAIKLSGSTHGFIFDGIKHVRKVFNSTLVRKSHKIMSLSLFSLW